MSRKRHPWFTASPLASNTGKCPRLWLELDQRPLSHFSSTSPLHARIVSLYFQKYASISLGAPRCRCDHWRHVLRGLSRANLVKQSPVNFPHFLWGFGRTSYKRCSAPKIGNWFRVHTGAGVDVELSTPAVGTHNPNRQYRLCDESWLYPCKWRRKGAAIRWEFNSISPEEWHSDYRSHRKWWISIDDHTCWLWPWDPMRHEVYLIY